MPQEAVVAGQQVLVIFVYILIGYFGVRLKVIAPEAGKSFSNLVLTFVMPSVIINSYLKPLEMEQLKGLGLAFLLAVLFHLLAICGSILLIRKREDHRYRIERMAAVYSNCGYMGIPLISAILGPVGVFYSVAYISVFNVLTWSHGVMALQGERRIHWKKILLNPGVLGFVIGFSIYLLQLQLPRLLTQVIGEMAALNTPVSMITTGIFLAFVNIGESVRQIRLYYVSFLRLLVFPLAMIFLVWGLGAVSWMGETSYTVVRTSILACACPTATIATLMPGRLGLDSEYGAKLIGLSTLFSVLTLPLLYVLCDQILK